VLGVIGSNPGPVKKILLCSRHVVILHYTKNYYSKVLCFPKIFSHASLYDPVAGDAIVDQPHSLFVRHVGTTDCRK
jgi:hypothetical protein